MTSLHLTDYADIFTLAEVQELAWIDLRSWKYQFKVPCSQCFVSRLAKHPAKISRNRKVPAFIQLLIRQPWPLAVDLTALDPSAQHEHYIRVTVVRASSSILPGRAAKLRHRHQRHILRIISHVLPEGGDRVRKLLQPVGQL